MKLSDEARKMIQLHEGYVDHVYLDPAGHATIGWGHLIKPGESFPKTITREQATELFDADVAIAEKSVTRLVLVPLTQGQFDALVDFVFNLGQGRLANSTLLRLLNAGNYDNAAIELHRWVLAGGRKLPGLVKRRRDAFNLWHGNGEQHDT
jgi:lysozyme